MASSSARALELAETVVDLLGTLVSHVERIADVAEAFENDAARAYLASK